MHSPEMNKMKLQTPTLLRMRGSQTQFEQQERLIAAQQFEKNDEIKHLLGEINNLEKFKNLYGSMESKPSTSSNPCALEDSTYYADLLQLNLDKLSKEDEGTKADYLCREWRHYSRAKSENMKLTDELKLKYEPEEKIEVPVFKKRREVLP
ncbi:hypothetical protein A6R68_12691, partial [Neotoma lepida]